MTSAGDPARTEERTSPWSRLFALSWPMALGSASIAVIGFSDALMIAPLGEAPLAAVMTGALNTATFLMLPIGTLGIIQSFASQLHARRDRSGLNRYAWYGLLFSALAGGLALLTIPLLPAILSAFPYEDAVREPIESYMAIRFWALGFVVAGEALANWFIGIGEPRLAMLRGLVMVATTIALNYLLIEPRLGLPGYGVEGAAYAASLASLAGFCVVFFPFLSSWRRSRLELFDEPTQRLSVGEFLRLLRFGGPSGINQLLDFATHVVFVNVIVGHLGTTALAAFNVAMQINLIAVLPSIGVASAGSVLVGEAIGKREHVEVPSIVRRVLIVSCAWMAGVGLLYLVVPHTLVGLFRPRDLPAELLVETGATMLVLSALWLIFEPLDSAFTAILRASGDTAFCMLARLVVSWVIFIPAGYLIVVKFGGGVTIAMLLLAGYMALTAAILGLRFASGKWRTIELV